MLVQVKLNRKRRRIFMPFSHNSSTPCVMRCTEKFLQPSRPSVIILPTYLHVRVNVTDLKDDFRTAAGVGQGPRCGLANTRTLVDNRQADSRAQTRNQSSQELSHELQQLSRGFQRLHKQQALHYPSCLPFIFDTARCTFGALKLLKSRLSKAPV